MVYHKSKSNDFEVFWLVMPIVTICIWTIFEAVPRKNSYFWLTQRLFNHFQISSKWYFGTDNSDYEIRFSISDIEQNTSKIFNSPKNSSVGRILVTGIRRKQISLIKSLFSSKNMFLSWNPSKFYNLLWFWRQITDL